MNDLQEAVKAEIAELKADALKLPECSDEYQNQAWGVFRLWLRLAGYQGDDENEEIAQMRDYCTKW